MLNRLTTVAALGTAASFLFSTPAIAASLTPTRPVSSPVVSNGWILDDAELQWNTEYSLEVGDELLSTRLTNQGVFENVTIRTGQFDSIIGLGAESTKQLQLLLLNI